MKMKSLPNNHISKSREYQSLNNNNNNSNNNSNNSNGNSNSKKKKEQGAREEKATASR